MDKKCYQCNKVLIPTKHTHGFCASCYQMIRYHTDSNYKKRHSEYQKQWNENKKKKRLLVSKMSSWRIHGRNLSTVELSASYKGRKWEFFALAVLPDSIDCNSESWGKHHDIEWKGKKIDIKSRNFSQRKFWSFVKGNKNDADYYFCVCEKDNEAYKIYLIPKDKFGTGVSIGFNKSKFDEYLIYPKFILPSL